MLSGQEEINNLLEKAQRISKLAIRYGTLGTEFAEAERAYRESLAMKMYELRDQKIPVTIIGDLSRGDHNVALLRAKRDSAEAFYKAQWELIQAEKLELKILSDQIKMEYSAE
jgi:hypothetical protein